MKKILAGALLLALVPAAASAADASGATATAAVVPARGKMLVAADGARLAPVYQASDSGAQIILDGRMVTVPSNTLAVVGGKVQTSLTKAQVIALP